MTQQHSVQSELRFGDFLSLASRWLESIGSRAVCRWLTSSAVDCVTTLALLLNLVAGLDGIGVILWPDADCWLSILLLQATLLTAYSSVEEPVAELEEGMDLAKTGVDNEIGCFTTGSSKLTEERERVCEYRRRRAEARSKSGRADKNTAAGLMQPPELLIEADDEPGIWNTTAILVNIKAVSIYTVNT